MSYPKKLTSSASFSPSIRISLRLRIHQAQAKNFCRVLDIRVSEVVYSDLLNTSSASARTFISFMRPDFVKEKILLYNLLILRITSILKIMLVIDNPYGSR